MAEASLPRRSSLEIAVEMFGAYELYMLVLSAFSILVLAADTLLPLPGTIKDVLMYTDAGLCILFFADFVRCLRRAPNRGRYFLRAGWLDLLSSVPTIDALRVGRLSRIARLFKLLRAMRSARTIHSIISAQRKKSALFATALIAILLLVASSIAILQVEIGPDVNIKTGGEALWWAFATITTVGYGDYYPVTFAGRLVASVLMAAGLGFAGVLAGVAASWFLVKDEPAAVDASRIDGLGRQITELRGIIEWKLLQGREAQEIQPPASIATKFPSTVQNLDAPIPPQ